MDGQRAVFMSYAHADDDHDRLISDLRNALESEIRLQSGHRDFAIYQDRTRLRWGENWPSRIDDAIDTAAALIAVMTPSFFASRECLREVERFLLREKANQRNDLIFPLYLASCPVIEDLTTDSVNSVASELRLRQQADWRDLRHLPLTSTKVRQKIAHLATAICRVLDRAPYRVATKLVDDQLPKATNSVDKMFDRGELQVINILHHRRPVLCLAFSPDGERIATGADDGIPRIWDFRSGEISAELSRWHLCDAITDLAFTRGGKYLVAGRGQRRIQVFEMRSGQMAESLKFPMHGNDMRVATSDDATSVAATAAANSGTFLLWHSSTRAQSLYKVGLDTFPLRAITYIPGRDLIALGGASTTELWMARG
jgi:hypothetical protein